MARLVISGGAGPGGQWDVAVAWPSATRCPGEREDRNRHGPRPRLADRHRPPGPAAGQAEIAAMDRHRGTAGILRSHPELLAQGIEEFLRYDSPVQLASRVVRRDTTLGEALVRRGGQVS